MNYYLNSAEVSIGAAISVTSYGVVGSTTEILVAATGSLCFLIGVFVIAHGLLTGIEAATATVD